MPATRADARTRSDEQRPPAGGKPGAKGKGRGDGGGKKGKG
ncbi:MAG TPA: hypothetical protein VGH76_11485 [Actinomycetospora sp.]